MKKRAWLSTVLAFVCATSLLFGCGGSKQSDNGDQTNSESAVLPDSNISEELTSESEESSEIPETSESEESSEIPETSEAPEVSEEPEIPETSEGTEGGNEKIDLPEDYVITMSDMERFLLTKDEQYPITNEYVELYQQASGGYIDNALKAGLTVDKTQHLPSDRKSVV